MNRRGNSQKSNPYKYGLTMMAGQNGDLSAPPHSHKSTTSRRAGLACISSEPECRRGGLAGISSRPTPIAPARVYPPEASRIGIAATCHALPCLHSDEGRIPRRSKAIAGPRQWTCVWRRPCADYVVEWFRCAAHGDSSAIAGLRLRVTVVGRARMSPRGRLAIKHPGAQNWRSTDVRAATRIPASLATRRRNTHLMEAHRDVQEHQDTLQF